jgi:hypothetical protein
MRFRIPLHKSTLLRNATLATAGPSDLIVNFETLSGVNFETLSRVNFEALSGERLHKLE